jgi:hypothetical protein
MLEDVLNEWLEFLAGLLRDWATKALSYWVNHESVFEILDAESLFFLDVHSDSGHDFAQTVLVHYRYFKTFKRLSFFK